LIITLINQKGPYIIRENASNDVSANSMC